LFTEKVKGLPTHTGPVLASEGAAGAAKIVTTVVSAAAAQPPEAGMVLMTV
jgi:hypothetical protein